MFTMHLNSSPSFCSTLVSCGKSLTLTFTCTGLYALWRLYTRIETKRIQRLAEDFVRNGYVVISGVAPSRKRHYWTTVLAPILQRFWQQRHTDFDMNTPSTWPCPDDGKAYVDTFEECVPGMPQLISENYEAQAILVYFCSGSNWQRSISFGRQTHWRLKLLISPLWALGIFSGRPLSLPEEEEEGEKKTEPGMGMQACHLVGKEQSWHLVNWPASTRAVEQRGGSVVGSPIEGGAHIDSGEKWSYGDYGLPPMYPPLLPCDEEKRGTEKEEQEGGRSDTDPPPLELNMSAASSVSANITPAVLATLLIPQLAILFHSESPGDLTPQQGMTGFYTRSHMLFIAALREALSRLNTLPLPDTDTDTPRATSPPHPCPNLSLAVVSQALKKWGNLPQSRASLWQPTLRDGEALLCCGALVHTSMWSQEPMHHADLCAHPHETEYGNRDGYGKGDGNGNSNGNSDCDCMTTPRVLQNLKVYFASSDGGGGGGESRRHKQPTLASFLSIFKLNAHVGASGGAGVGAGGACSGGVYCEEEETQETQESEEEEVSLAWRLVRDPWRLYRALTPPREAIGEGTRGGADSEGDSEGEGEGEGKECAERLGQQEEEEEDEDIELFRARVTELADLFLEVHKESLLPSQVIQ